MSWAAGLVAARGTPVHLFGRRPFAEGAPGVHNHPVGDCVATTRWARSGSSPAATVTPSARAFPLGAAGVTLLAHDWSAVPAR